MDSMTQSICEMICNIIQAWGHRNYNRIKLTTKITVIKIQSFCKERATTLSLLHFLNNYNEH